VALITLRESVNGNAVHDYDSYYLSGSPCVILTASGYASLKIILYLGQCAEAEGLLDIKPCSLFFIPLNLELPLFVCTYYIERELIFRVRPAHYLLIY
jgi:hypothetical protein